ncbi:hypothetical protein ACMFMG_002842 [Clarireedia jacksonii]
MAPISISLDSAQFRSKFSSFFTLDPDLELAHLYALLSKYDFDIEEARLDLAGQVERRKRWAEWLVPRDALDQLAASIFGSESDNGSAELKRSNTNESTPIQTIEDDDEASNTYNHPYRDPSDLAKVEINLITDSDSDTNLAEINLNTDSDDGEELEEFGLHSDSEPAGTTSNADSDSKSSGTNLNTDSDDEEELEEFSLHSDSEPAGTTSNADSDSKSSGINSDSDGELDWAGYNFYYDREYAGITSDADSEAPDKEVEGDIKPRILKRTFSGAFDDSDLEIKGGSPMKPHSPRKSATKKEVAEALTTPLVQKLAGRIFVKPMAGIGSKGERINGEKAVKDHENAMEIVRESANQFLLDAIHQPKQEYKVGDCVVVKENTGDGYDIAQPLLNLRYGRIIRLSDKSHKTKIHMLWFVHGADIEALKELARPKELFLVSDCSKVRPKKILTKIRVEYRGNDTTESPYSESTSEEYTDGDHYFYRFQYNPNGHMFTTAPERQSCISCERRKTEAQENQLSMLDEGKDGLINSFMYQRKHYEVLDFVYYGDFGPNGDQKNKMPYRIGQIKKIRVLTFSNKELLLEDLIIYIEVYERSDKFHPGWSANADAKQTIRDERKLFCTRRTEKVNPDHLDGRCFVKHVDHIGNLNDYKDMDDTFWVADQLILFRYPEEVMPLPAEQLKYSKASIKSLMLRKERADRFKKYGTRLLTMDVFSGAGGLSRGFHESGVAGKTYAIELDRAAFLTIQKNNPDFLGLNQDASALLRWAVMNEADLSPHDLTDIEGNKMPRMPKVGSVCLITGGPPCPGFSGLNRHRSPDYPTNLLLAVYLSYVELYRPWYFLLENVAGMWHTPAAEYGCPQGRKRLIVWASLPGYELPKFPQPSHLFSGMNGGTNYHQERKSAPHFAITIGDALMDLPKFEWENIHRELEETNEQRVDRESRAKKGITQLHTSKGRSFVGYDNQAYASKLPLSEYQRRMRRGISSDKLRNHITSVPSELFCERVCNVPLVPNADHRSIPGKLLIGRGKGEAGEYGRLGLEDQFKIATTRTSRWNLHPSQHRTFTIRENSRVQGFADDIIWDTDIMSINDIHKQIGNAVPVPLAVALSKGLLDVLVDKLETDNRGLGRSMKEAIYIIDDSDSD